MMDIDLRFDRAVASKFLHSLRSGTVSGPVAEEDLLALAGACMYLAFERTRAEKGLASEDELKELYAVVLHGVSSCAGWTMAIADGSYDEKYKPTIRSTVAKEGGTVVVSYPMSWGGDNLG